MLAVDHFADHRTDKIGKLIRAAAEYSQYGRRNQRNTNDANHDGRDTRTSLIDGSLVIITIDIDINIDDNIRLVRFPHGIHLLAIIGPQKLRGLPIRQ